MKVTLRVITIDVTQVRQGYVILHNDFLGIVNSTDRDKTTISFPDNTEEIIATDDAKHLIAKFIVQTPDLRSYPVVHTNFIEIVETLKTRDICKNFLHKNNKVEGSFRNIPLLPKADDIIELININIAEKYKLLATRKDRIGTVLGAVSKFKHKIDFGNKIVIDLARNDIKIISGDDSKQVFELIRNE